MARSRKCLARGVLFSVTAILSSAAAFAGSGSDVPLAIGPLEHVNLKTSTIVVLGQTYNVSAGALAAGKSPGLAALTPGTLVVVRGKETASGRSTVKSLTVLPQLDVPGATQLLVTGIVSGLSNVGQIRLGKLSVDINSALAGNSPQVTSGELVQVVGTQPIAGGLFLAQSIANGIQGSGPSSDGIQGSGPNSNGIQGSGPSSNGIQGSGVVSLGIQGSGPQSNGIQGSGPSSNGIQGSGVVSLGIQGSGPTSKGIQGSGPSSNGIQGSGVVALGIQGSGPQSNGIQGSGPSSNGIQGSGVVSLGIQGSGPQSNGIQGSGVVSLGIQGSGPTSNGIQGSGQN